MILRFRVTLLNGRWQQLWPWEGDGPAVAARWEELVAQLQRQIRLPYQAAQLIAFDERGREHRLRIPAIRLPSEPVPEGEGFYPRSSGGWSDSADHIPRLAPEERPVRRKRRRY